MKATEAWADFECNCAVDRGEYESLGECHDSIGWDDGPDAEKRKCYEGVLDDYPDDEAIIQCQADALTEMVECVIAKGCIDPGDQFECDDGEILGAYWVCDGDDDCVGGEDEVDCGVICDDVFDATHEACGETSETYQHDSTRTCDSYRCEDGRLISDDWVCDGKVDCTHADDETSC
jgi:hypothetical protein